MLPTRSALPAWAGGRRRRAGLPPLGVSRSPAAGPHCPSPVCGMRRPQALRGAVPADWTDCSACCCGPGQHFELTERPAFAGRRAETGFNTCASSHRPLHPPSPCPSTPWPCHVQGSLKAAQELLALGIDCNLQNRFGQTPLHFAVRRPGAAWEGNRWPCSCYKSHLLAVKKNWRAALAYGDGSREGTQHNERCMWRRCTPTATCDSCVSCCWATGLSRYLMSRGRWALLAVPRCQ